MTKQLSLLAAAIMMGSALDAFSGTVTADEARALAAEFLSSKTGLTTDAIRLKEVNASVSNKSYYVFNTVDNTGFVIISAETSATPVLGYSTESAYPVSAEPTSMKWVMSGLEREIKVAPSVQSSLSATDLKKSARRAAQKAQARLLSTPSWSQEAPFNSMIPGRPLVGCVGTAMATVMKYYEYPAAGSGEYGGVDFNAAYAWADMRTDNYRSGYSDAEGDAVAQLMYHASKSIDTQYSMSGSSAYEVRVPAALSTYFGYDPGVSYKKRSEVATQAAWDQMVKDEIDAGRPVIYCGQDVTAGHAFVCDGYEGEYLHFNWGWGGSANGYFLSTALNPTVSRQHHYNNLNTIIYNIKPASGEITTWSPIHITADGNQAGMGSDLTNLASGKTFNVRVGNLKNLSYTDFSGKIAVALYSKTGAMKGLLSNASSFNMQSMGYLFNGYVDFNNCKLPSGVTVADDDCVRIATQAAGSSEWLPVAGELPTVNSLAVNVAAPASFAVQLPSGVAGVTIAGEASVIKGWNYSFRVTPESSDKVVTVKANGYMLTASPDYTYTIANVREDQTVNVLVQNASDVKEKRSIWVETPGTLSSLISDEESGTIKELTLFGSVDARDFAFMRGSMQLRSVDLSGVYIAAHGTDQANALPREAFRGAGSLKSVVLPKNLNRMNNGCFRQCGITSITIPSGVKTYEYNVFCGASSLRDIYVGRESAEFINWCVLSGVRVAETTLHVPSERAVSNYSNAENWKTIANIVVDPIVDSSDVMFAVMDNSEVNYESATLAGKMTKGSVVSFTATHTADNDNRMEVYANSTLLTPDANGVYTTTVNANTIIHFGLVAPIAVDANKSAWTLTGKNGSVGMLTDAVNVIPGQEFTIRVNTLNVPQYYDQLYWAAALTDAKGNIKEFISPVLVWTGGASDSHRMNVNCVVKESKVREGNMIRLVTSANKRNWNVVKAAGSDLVDALPALNNMNTVYNITLTTKGAANISGLPETAVRGRDVTMNITPASAAHRINLKINDELVASAAASVNRTFVVMEDTKVDVEVFDPRAGGVVTLHVTAGKFQELLTKSNVCETVVVTGEVNSYDLQAATGQDFAISTIKTLDLRGVKILGIGNFEDNVINHPFFVPTNGMSYSASVVENILLPDNVVRIAGGVFGNCAKIKELTLPKNLRNVPIKPDPNKNILQYGLGDDALKGCDALEVIRIPGEPGVYNGKATVAHHNPWNIAYYSLGHPDAKKVTVIVPQEYLSVYKTSNTDRDYGNPWLGHGYNILSEDPVYGVNYDPARITTVEPDYDITKMAVFLMDNVSLNSIKAEGKLKLTNPSANCLVYDNGKLIQPNTDGTIDLEFFNPAKNAAAAGNHNLSVVYTHDLAFHTTSDIFTLSQPEVLNESEYKSGAFDTTNPLAPVLKAVAENSTVKFGLNFASEHADEMEVHVMMGQQELVADADGTYSVDIANAAKTVEIFAVPTNGATLNADDLAALDPAQTGAVTEICLTGNMTQDDLAAAVECFPSLESLDLSSIEGELPEGAFQNMTSLTTVSLPEVESLGDNLFAGCTSLQNIDIPASVNTIGAGTFAGCTSLSSVSLTGVNEIGSGAFEGCDNLTSITLLADVAHSAQGAPRRAPRRAQLADDAFKGLNPNCFVVVDEGAAAPGKGVNVLYTSTGMISEEQPDGSTIEREGRIYTATSAVTLNPAYAVNIPHTFTLADDAAISMAVENEKWTAIAIPFDAEKITDAAGEDVELSLIAARASNASGNFLYSLSDDDATLTCTTDIKANKPYLFHVENPGAYTFAAKGIKVASTPEIATATGSKYAINVAYTATERPASETYLLSEGATAFVPAGGADETVTVKPFEIYATSPMAQPEILTLLPDAEETTGIEVAEADVTELTVMVAGKTMVVYSPEDRTEMLYSIDGRAVKEVSLKAGRNEVEVNLTGIFIFTDKKLKF